LAALPVDIFQEIPSVSKKIWMAELVIGCVLKVPVFGKFVSVQLPLKRSKLGRSKGLK